jgi:hypothetical protein
MKTKYAALFLLFIAQTVISANFVHAECTLSSEVEQLKSNFNASLDIINNAETNRKAVQLVLAEYLNIAINQLQIQQSECSSQVIAEAEYAINQAGEFVNKSTITKL